MRRKTLLCGLAALVLVAVATPGRAAETLQPYQMVRSLQLVQDRIAAGDHAALPMQAKLLEMIDARPFRSETYDNWRLSTARAHAAYYMLVRSGVDEHRIAEVAGFADRQPKDAADPLAAVNRRIEILLEAQ